MFSTNAGSGNLCVSHARDRLPKLLSRSSAQYHENAPQREADLQSLLEFAGNYPDLDSFLNELSLVGNSLVSDRESMEWEDPEHLTLTTIHQAKGLEWEVVFLIGLTEGLFPHQRSMNSNEQLEEERRLFYVALTRASNA